MSISQDMTDRGPGLWSKIHLWALAGAPGDRGKWVQEFVAEVECGDCRQHAMQWVKEHPPGEDVFAWSVEWHNDVSRRLGKPEISVEAARVIWSKPRPAMALPMFPVAHGSPAWQANMSACRACLHYRNGIPETCKIDGEQCSTHALRGDCTNQPYHKWLTTMPAAAASPATAGVGVVQLPASWPSALPDLPEITGAAIGPQSWREYFGRCFVVNLARRPDRLDAFRAGLPSPWPIPDVERVAAIDGALIPIPSDWRAGAGAFGLMRTYQTLLERGLHEGWDKPIVLFEDDAVFVPDFAERLGKSLANLPADWDAVWLGGQHKGERLSVAPGIVRSAGIHRTHAFAVHPRFFKMLLRIWQEGWDHVDWCITRCSRKFKIFAVDPFLAGQAAGPSDIGNGHASLHAWDGRTGNLLKDIDPPEVARFNAGAKFGDLIYCLPILRAAGGGHLKYQSRVPDGYSGEQFMRLMSPLLDLQPYVKSVLPGQYGGAIAVDLEGWRSPGKWKAAGANLAGHYATHAAIAGVDLNTPWLTVDNADQRARVIINRSQRYRNERFPWRRVLEKYAGDVAFVGIRPEYDAFTQAFGSVPWIETGDYLQLARVIAGAELFIGNQSSAYALAEGLKMRSVQEVCIGNADCVFDRPNANYGRDEFVLLPELA